MHTPFRPLLLSSLAFTFLLVACGKKVAPDQANIQTGPPPQPVSITLGTTTGSDGLVQTHTSGDGQTKEARVGDKDCHQLVARPGRGDAYLYLQADPAFKNRDLSPLTVTVEYFNIEPISFRVEYNSTVAGAKGSYTRSREQHKSTGSNEWREARFLLERPHFSGRQNSKADFRLRLENADKVQFYVRSVALSMD